MVSALAAVLNIPLDLSRDMGPSLVISVEGREVLESRQALLILEKKVITVHAWNQVFFLIEREHLPDFHYV